MALGRFPGAEGETEARSPGGGGAGTHVGEARVRTEWGQRTEEGGGAAEEAAWGGCPETGLRKRGSFGKKLRPGWDPVGVRGPGAMFRKPRKARPRVQGRGQGQDRGVEVLSGEGKRKLWGVLGVMPQKEVSGEAGGW